MAITKCLQQFDAVFHCVPGTFTVLSIMVGSVTERLAPDVDFFRRNGTNVTAELDISARDAYRVQVAAATTLLGGLIQVRSQLNTKKITS